MAYIGNTPAESFASFEKQVFTIVNSQTAYTLSHSVVNENDIRLVVNNVVQEPGSGKAYTASGTTLTLSAALVNGTDEMYCVFLGRALQTVNPPSGSVGSSQVAASIITGQTALGATPADTDELLISDAGTLKRVDYSYLKSSMTPAFQARLSGNYTLANNTQSVIPLDTDNSSPKSFDTDSAFDTSNYRFTVPSGEDGKYFLYATARFDEAIASDRCNVNIQRNGSALSIEGEHQGAHQYFTVSASGAAVLSAGDYITLTLYQDSGSSKTVRSDVTFLGGYKIIE